MVLDPIPVTPNLVEGTIIVASCLYESVWQIRDLGKWLELKLKFRFYITTKCTDDNLCHFTTVIQIKLPQILRHSFLYPTNSNCLTVFSNNMLYLNESVNRVF